MVAKLRIWIGKHKLASIGLGIVGLISLCCVSAGLLVVILPPDSTARRGAAAPTSTRRSVTPRGTLAPRVEATTSVPTAPVSTLDVMATATLFAQQVEQTQTTESMPTLEPATAAPIARTAVPAGSGNTGACPNGCAVSTPPPGCDIKGNVNSEGERIYHIPGGPNYGRTLVQPAEGDRWFCTTDEAVANGFRAPR